MMVAAAPPRRKRSKKARRIEAAEELLERSVGGISRWLEADEQRWLHERCSVEQTPLHADARSEAIAYHDNGLTGAFYWTWLYSGDEHGNKIGPAPDGCIPVKRTGGGGGHTPEQNDEARARLELYQATVDRESPLNRLIFVLMAIAPMKVRTGYVEWTAARLSEHSVYGFNDDGSAWNGEAVRRRSARINERIARRVLGVTR